MRNKTIVRKIGEIRKLQQAETVEEIDAIPYGCPFSDDGSFCGSWCPAFTHVDNVVFLRCFPSPGVALEVVDSLQ